ncbi:MAG: DpnD/PcfM family protein [Sulfurimonas sp.]|nr:DpnD/PcfM family protein [Sulfurimonas sp.]
MKIEIRVTETLSRVIILDSSSVEEAIKTVEEMYFNEDIVLDYTDFKDDVVIEEVENN